MAGGDFENGLSRVNSRESNNRRMPLAKGMSAKVPVKPGAKRGFAANPVKNGKIAMPRAGRKV